MKTVFKSTKIINVFSTSLGYFVVDFTPVNFKNIYKVFEK